MAMGLCGRTRGSGECVSEWIVLRDRLRCSFVRDEAVLMLLCRSRIECYRTAEHEILSLCLGSSQHGSLLSSLHNLT